MMKVVPDPGVQVWGMSAKHDNGNTGRLRILACRSSAPALLHAIESWILSEARDIARHWGRSCTKLQGDPPVPLAKANMATAASALVTFCGATLPQEPELLDLWHPRRHGPSLLSCPQLACRGTAEQRGQYIPVSQKPDKGHQAHLRLHGKFTAIFTNVLVFFLSSLIWVNFSKKFWI